MNSDSRRSVLKLLLVPETDLAPKSSFILWVSEEGKDSSVDSIVQVIWIELNYS